jgi:pimeloyl-ACP methyl ester carboxylesterase
VLEKYKDNGGKYRELVMQGCAHAAHLEDSETFLKEMTAFLEG